MDFTLANWMMYTMCAVLGLMMIDFLIAFFKSFWIGSFSPTIVLDYLKDILYYVFPLNIIISLIPLDPTDWILVIFYFLGGLGLMVKYIMDIKGKF
ncbi:hypothetical protein J2S09_003799 [Bacillus fengqiuensis]|nr:hypothetical protein [Bacillus fengqiuensis]